MSSNNTTTDPEVQKIYDEMDRLSPYCAPSGQFYERNDIEYLINNGYSLQDAKDALSRSPKYLSQYKAPNGQYFDANDIEYLLDNGYSLKDALDELAECEQYSDGTTHQPNTGNSTIYNFSIFGAHSFCDDDDPYYHNHIHTYHNTENNDSSDLDNSYSNDNAENND
ncbi:hypothetical protein [Selenomonas ruminantium]|uniref:Uncharacterized protein n=1 Tax=Selenomonas ruminantium TaxID=971 RepID=A0A1I0V441_SELRU|nr:hypothetical protein [Selenomonas ruminantium]SFA70316.1 hypothetical protein SAMN05216587_101177 [Selenomonas ruminantium]